MPQHPPELLAQLAAHDTPTVCNALEVLDPAFTLYSYTKRFLRCSHPDRPARVGYARTAAIRTTRPHGEDTATLKARRLAYYDYINAGDGPKICVHQDLDDEAGIAACWGDVVANLHYGMGCVGVVTNGAFRDIPGMPDGIMMLARGEKPSHGELHLVAVGEPVQIDGLMVRDGDLVHMDRNGAAVIPHALAADLPAAIAEVVAKEAALIKAAQQRPFDYATIRRVMGG
jgi:regulator of RNase E activity RraA